MLHRLTVVLILFFALSSPAQADEATKSLSLSASLGFFSDYMFRGVNLYDGTSIQPAVSGTFETEVGTFSASTWLHISAEGDRQAEKFLEMDDTLSYSAAVGPTILKVGHIWYTYPDNSDAIKDTAEWFAGLQFDDSEFNEIFSLSPALTFYQDYRVTDAQYYELGFSHTFKVNSENSPTDVTPYLTFAFASNADKAYADNSGLMHVTYGVSSNVPVGSFILTPALHYTHKVDAITANEFWFGVNIGYAL